MLKFKTSHLSYEFSLIRRGRRLHVLLAICILTLGQLADASCTHLLWRSKPLAFHRSIPASYRPLLNESINEIHPFIAKLKTPRTVLLSFEAVVDNDQTQSAFLLPADWQISIPEQRTTFPYLSQTLQHEYGHAVFLANLGSYIPEWQPVYDSFKGHDWRSLSRNLFTLAKRKRSVTDSIYFAYMTSEPYQELFADIIVIVVANDPNAMKRAVEINVPSTAIHRSGELDAFQASWSQRLPHGLFAPVRGFLWHRYLKNQSDNSKRAEVIAILFRTLALEVKERAPFYESMGMQPEVMIRQLLLALDKNLKGYEML